MSKTYSRLFVTRVSDIRDTAGNTEGLISIQKKIQ